MLPIVAVLDTGYRPHGDLGADYINGPSLITDPAIAGSGVGRGGDGTDPGDFCDAEETTSSWHGVKVASQIMATRNNGYGITGAASASPGC
ncbi:MAG: hypothetical protein MZW92_57245 [Comamonadaceae bacterium]|nr:hypothetical protein [Comamonadaceae bacterium]